MSYLIFLCVKQHNLKCNLKISLDKCVFLQLSGDNLDNYKNRQRPVFHKVYCAVSLSSNTRENIIYYICSRDKNFSSYINCINFSPAEGTYFQPNGIKRASLFFKRCHTLSFSKNEKILLPTHLNISAKIISVNILMPLFLDFPYAS